MDKQKQNQEQKGNGNGFLLGVIIGVLITLLFTTKRGREILHDLTEKGLRKFSELEKFTEDINVKDFYGESEEEAGDDYQETDKSEEVKILAKEEAVQEKAAEAPKEKEAKPAPKPKEEKKSSEKTIAGRRWFRGLGKKG